MSLIFFDNRAEEVADMVQGIAHAYGVHVSDTVPHPFLSSNGWNTMDYPKAFRGNEYAEIVIRAGGEEFMPSLGLTSQHIQRLKEWASQSTSPLIAAFDWDRTLTVVEGMLIPDHREWNQLNQRWPWSRSDMADYLFGGKRRLVMIQELFKWLHHNGIHVFIVTRNTSAVTSKGPFYDMIRYIDPDFMFDHLVYTSDRRTKSDALRSNREYNIIIAPFFNQVKHYLSDALRANREYNIIITPSSNQVKHYLRGGKRKGSQIRTHRRKRDLKTRRR